MTPNKFLLDLMRMYPKTYPIYVNWLGLLYRRIGVEQGTIAISFDNDYANDEEATQKILPILRYYQVPATWAVIGQRIKNNIMLHQRILEDGHELMNHSWSHPDNRELRPEDKRKFNEIGEKEVKREIVLTHELCKDRLNYKMVGFRSPHFRINSHSYRILKNLGYQYTSEKKATHMPVIGMASFLHDDLLELPLAMIPRTPRRVFETYPLFRKPDGLYTNEQEFFNDFVDMLTITKKHKLISCLYFDACDIVMLKKPDFSIYLEEAHRLGVRIMTYRDLSSFLFPRIFSAY